MTEKPKTIGELKQAGCRIESVKDEIRRNLITKLRSGEELFPGLVGYEDSVEPQVVAALLAKQNFILLGLRGQAKTRLIRSLESLLDEEIPVVAGSEINDHPLAPVSSYARSRIQEEGDNTPVEWVPRSRRYVEKLATPDTTIADLLGDIDPIRAAKTGVGLSDDLAMTFGLLPRSNRGIFCMNELPDLAGKVQVGLFNVMQEGDVQIKGYPVRLPLDLLIVFTANPEDYTARGKIISPLKDRIGVEIRTHYPRTLEDGMEITLAESWLSRGADTELEYSVSKAIREIIEATAFIARADQRIDQLSGVSQRLPISLLESALSQAEMRALRTGENQVNARICDIYAALPALTGKIELEYEGEQIGAEKITQDLIRRACGEVYRMHYSDSDPEPVVEAFESGSRMKLDHSLSDQDFLAEVRSIPGVTQVIAQGSFESDTSEIVKAELLLEGLYAARRIARKIGSDGKSSWTAADPEPQRVYETDEIVN